MSDVPSTVFDLHNPGNYVNEYINENVGKVSGHDYKYYEKGMDGKITYMTCDEYIDKCTRTRARLQMLSMKLRYMSMLNAC